MQTFSKAERLTSKILFERLVKNGNFFTVFPFKAIWLEQKEDSTFPVQLAISVSKKRFKKAIDRNRIKRLTREAYRRHKQNLYEAFEGKKKIILLLVFISSEIPEYKEVEDKIKLIIQRLKDNNAGPKIHSKTN